MNSILIKNVRIADPQSSLNGKVLDAYIQNGVFYDHKPIDFELELELDVQGLAISPGWIDALSFCGEPGEEWREDIQSLANCAHLGGFTQVAAFCGTHPFPDKASAISSILNRAQNLPVSILPLGTATKKRESKEMAELNDMFVNGAVAVTDADQPIESAGLKSRIMEYAWNCKTPFLDFALDADLSRHGVMHDGATSNSLGLKGIPAIAEVNKVSESISLAKWLGTPLRILNISCEESVSLIRSAKKEGLEIIAAVPIMNLLFTDENLASFDENYKIMPPLRAEADRLALLTGLMDGTIDAVVSNHLPQDGENKNVEFEYAAFGAISLQTVFGMLLKALNNNFSYDSVVNALHYGPAKLLGLNSTPIENGVKSDFTLFSNNGSWKLDKQSNASKSKNTPLMDTELPGSIVGTIYHSQWLPILNNQHS